MLGNKSTGGLDSKTYAITSGKGGVGKTSCAVNLSITLSRAGFKVLLIDADMGLANVDLLTGVSAPHTIEEVIRGEASIFDALAEGPEGLTLLTAGSGLEDISTIAPDKAGKFEKELLKLENAFDFVFIDTGAGISANVIDFVFMADEVIVIMTPEPTAFADAYAMVKIVTLKEPSLKVSVIINQSSGEHASRIIFDKFREIVEKFLGRNVVYHGCIAQDKTVAESVMRQIPLALFASKSPAMQSIRKIARNMLGLESPKPRTIFNR